MCPHLSCIPGRCLGYVCVCVSGGSRDRNISNELDSGDWFNVREVLLHVGLPDCKGIRTLHCVPSARLLNRQRSR